MINTESVRRQMVQQQVRTWDVSDLVVLDTLSSVTRDDYVPAAFRDCAYADAETPIGHGQCMLRPSIVGRLMQSLAIQPGDRVLDVGTGTGYLAHCLSLRGESVTSIELYEDFANGARQRLDAASVSNVEVRQMDASVELPDGPFDAIAVTAAFRELDDRLIDRLAPGGRLFIVVGEAPVMSANLVTRADDGDVTVENLFETRIPALVTADKPVDFSF
jgi:protein-L-isoaspartate(D-aspartate) O-methyltransferase